jgi:prefoldin subunit 5
MTTQQSSNQTLNGFAPEAIGRIFNEAADHSRAYVEKSLRVLQDGTLELVNRRIDSTGSAIEEYRNCKDFADVVTAQHKWFADLNRDYFDAWRRFGEATQRLMSNREEELHHETDEMEETLREAGREIEREARHAAE